jgi:ribosomal protein S18 acetylase RimI-like enzyme
MSDPEVALRTIDGDRRGFLPLLIEADESESVVRTYLHDGELFELFALGERVGVVLLTTPDPLSIEIKNFVIERERRRQGVGRAAIAGIAAHARARGAGRLLVGTADSSAATIAFYRACGFHDAGRVAGFFDAYPEPVIEDGVQAHDMVRFELIL